MARTKGSANLAASLEILAEAPADARLVVNEKSDLTVANNFPYAYVGMPVAVKSEGKMYLLTATPVTSIDNWKEIGSGGSNLPTGGTTGQALVKHSNTDGDVEWATVEGTPSGGTTGQLLAKHSNTDHDVEWINAPSSIPNGGTTGQVLAKHSNTDKDVEWQTVMSRRMKYSTEEQIVGEWIDGKPLYQKTINAGAMPANSTDTSVAHGISNIDKVLFVDGVFLQTNRFFPLQFPPCYNLNETMLIYVDKTNIYKRSSGENRSGFTAYVTLQYTKTTD